MLVGPSESGKSFRVCSILSNLASLVKSSGPVKNVVFCYAVWQPIYTAMRERGVVTKFVNKKPSCDEFVELVEGFKDDGGSVVVIDDFMADIDMDLVRIVTVHSRHYNTSTFLLFQSLFPPNKLARQISLNVKYLHVHKNPRENSQFQILARQISPRNWRCLVEAYNEVCKKPHACLLIDMTQSREEMLRYRSNYLPQERPMLVWLPKSSACPKSI